MKIKAKRYLDLNNSEDLKIVQNILFSNGDEELDEEESEETEDKDDFLEKMRASIGL